MVKECLDATAPQNAWQIDANVKKPVPCATHDAIRVIHAAISHSLFILKIRWI